MKHKLYTLVALIILLSTSAFSQTFKMGYSFEASADAMFFRYDPRINIPMSSYVTSIDDWSQLVSNQSVDIEEIYKRLDPAFATYQGRVAANVHLNGEYIKATFGVSTGRYQFRNFSWQGDVSFRYALKENLPELSFETGYMVVNDYSFGAQAALRSAKNTPKDLRSKMGQFLKQDLFEKPMSKGLKMGVYYNIGGCFDIGLTTFWDFVSRSDGARNDFASLGIRARLQ